VEVDPTTGLPKEAVDKKSNIEKISRFDAQKQKADELIDGLTSEKGQIILNKIKEHLLARINKLAEEDGECRALKRLLVDMGVTINIGEMAADKLMKLVTRQTP